MEGACRRLTMKFAITAGVAGLVLGAASIAAAQTAPAVPQWEGMQKAQWKRFDEAYQAPAVNFRAYTRIMLDPVEAVFRDNWQRDWNRDHRDLDNRLSNEDVQKILDEARTGFSEAFSRAAQESGYQVVTAPGPDVLRIKTSLIDLDVHAPDLMTSSQTRTFSEEAGSARLVLEFRDSSSGALLAGGVDKRDVGDMTFLERRTSVSNRADFSRAFRRWADFSFDALRSLGAVPARSAAG
jgi:hypothetical protein